jgi:hypothetical protein
VERSAGLDGGEEVSSLWQSMGKRILAGAIVERLTHNEGTLQPLTAGSTKAVLRCVNIPG